MPPNGIAHRPNTDGLQQLVVAIDLAIVLGGFEHIEAAPCFVDVRSRLESSYPERIEYVRARWREVMRHARARPVAIDS